MTRTPITRTLKRTITCTAAFAATAAPALALDGGAYVNLGAEALSFDDESSRVGSVRGVFAVGRAGFDFGRFVGVEVEGGFGSAEDSASFESAISLSPDFSVAVPTEITSTSEATSRWAVAVRGRVPIRDTVEAFVRLGGGQLSTDRSRSERVLSTGEVVDRFEGSRRVDAVMVGLGAQAMFGAERRNGVRLDLSAWGEPDFGDSDDSAVNYTTVTLAYVRKF